MNEKIIKTEDIMEGKVVYKHKYCYEDNIFEGTFHFRGHGWMRNSHEVVKDLVYLEVKCDVQEMYIDEHGDKYVVIGMYDSFILPDSKRVNFNIQQVSPPLIKTE